MFMNLQALRAVLMVVCAVALAFVAWRFILPLSVLYIAGVGVEVPLPKRLVMAYPKLAICLWRYIAFSPTTLFLWVFLTNAHSERLRLVRRLAMFKLIKKRQEFFR